MFREAGDKYRVYSRKAQLENRGKRARGWAAGREGRREEGEQKTRINLFIKQGLSLAALQKCFCLTSQRWMSLSYSGCRSCPRGHEHPQCGRRGLSAEVFPVLLPGKPASPLGQFQPHAGEERWQSSARCDRDGLKIRMQTGDNRTTGHIGGQGTEKLLKWPTGIL